jgi:hypothetical protein
MLSVHFQNGPDAAEIVLDEQFDNADEFAFLREQLLVNYRTVPEAVIWLEGQGKPPFPGSEPEAEKPAPKAAPEKPKAAEKPAVAKAAPKK